MRFNFPGGLNVRRLAEEVEVRLDMRGDVRPKKL